MHLIKANNYPWNTMLLPFRIFAKFGYTVVLICIISLVVVSVFIMPSYKIKGYIWQQPVNFRPWRFVRAEYANQCLKNKKISLAFSQLMVGLNVTAVLIEPSVLYCWLSLNEQAILNSRGFNISTYPTSKTMVRFALIGKTIETVDQSRLNDDIKKYGFSYMDTADGNTSFAHRFFKMSNKIIHAVVFQERENYYWSERLSSVPNFQDVTSEDFRFYKHDTAYERFATQRLIIEEDMALIIPADVTVFLHQLGSSKFLECDLSHSPFRNRIKTKQYKELVDAFTNSLIVLKSFLQPRLIDFFLWGGTHLGWYRDCDIIPYTSDVDFAAWASDIGDEKYWIETFRKDSKLNLIMTMGLPNEAFELRFASFLQKVDLFFVYEDRNTTWVSGHVPSRGYYFRYMYPMFTLCSGDLLGQKVLVPCEPLEIILTDYGSDWQKPISKWNYMSSPKNIGPPIYWSKEETRKTYETFY